MKVYRIVFKVIYCYKNSDKKLYYDNGIRDVVAANVHDAIQKVGQNFWRYEDGATSAEDIIITSLDVQEAKILLSGIDIV